MAALAAAPIPLAAKVVIGIGAGMFSGSVASDVISDVCDGVGDIVSGIVDGIGDFFGSLFLYVTVRLKYTNRFRTRSFYIVYLIISQTAMCISTELLLIRKDFRKS